MLEFKKDFSDPLNCPVTKAMGLIGGKWKPIILWAIFGGINRFGQLQRAIPTISKKVLTAQLRELEHDALITRKVYPVVPPKVVYSIAPLGKKTTPMIIALREFGLELAENDAR
ncbi:MAG: helix-turn-helix domain-containing protein [Cyclobacteriaceae bacterium]